MFKNAWGLALAAGSAALIVAGSTMAQSIADVCKQAESEPPLVWYSSQDPARNDAVVKAFSAVYPKIKTSSFRLASGALGARYASERDAKVINGDLVSLSDPNFVNAGLGKGWFVDFAQADLPAVGRLDPKYFGKGIAMTGINVIGISYNVNGVGGKPPTEWKDLLRPEFKGKIALADPRNVPSFVALFRILRDELGSEFVSALANQNLVVVPSAVPGTQQMAAGEYAIVFPNTLAVAAPVKAQGAPVDFATPPMTTGVEYTTMLSAGADSPNAAKCLYNYLFTAEGQQAFNGTTSVSPFSDIAGTAPLPGTYRDPKITELPAHEKDILSLLRIR